MGGGAGGGGCVNLMSLSCAPVCCQMATSENYDGREGPLVRMSKITRSRDTKNEARMRRTKLGCEERS